MKLYPPTIQGTLPPFDTKVMKIPYTQNIINTNNFNAFSIIIKNLKGSKIIAQAFTQNYTDSLITVDCSVFKYADEGFYDFSADSNISIGQHFKIQIACVKDYSKSSNDYEIGTYSTVGIAKHTVAGELFVENMKDNGFNMNIGYYVGVYTPNNLDSVEAEYSYSFSILDKAGTVKFTSEEQIHQTGKKDIWEIYNEFEWNNIYTLNYSIKTINGYTMSKTYQIQQLENNIKSNIEELDEGWVVAASMNKDNGYITLQLQNNKLSTWPIITGRYVLTRASSANNYSSWEPIEYFSLINEDPSSKVLKDFTVAFGQTYKYGIQQYNDSVRSRRIESKPITASFEDSFLFDGKRQLKIRFNPQVSSFKDDILENKIDTIGSRYPIFFRNQVVKYKEFPINGLISYLMDEENLFNSIHPQIKKQYRETTSASSDTKIEVINNSLSDINIDREREFKLDVMNWLADGKNKLFRSPTEGNYVVRLMGISLSPENTLGRMLHNFSCTAYEVNDKLEAVLRDDNLTAQQIIVKQIQINNQRSKKFDNVHGLRIINAQGAQVGIKYKNDNHLNVIRIYATDYELPYDENTTIDRVVCVKAPENKTNISVEVFSQEEINLDNWKKNIQVITGITEISSLKEFNIGETKQIVQASFQYLRQDNDSSETAIVSIQSKNGDTTAIDLVNIGSLVYSSEITKEWKSVKIENPNIKALISYIEQIEIQ